MKHAATLLSLLFLSSCTSVTGVWHLKSTQVKICKNHVCKTISKVPNKDKLCTTSLQGRLNLFGRDEGKFVLFSETTSSCVRVSSHNYTLVKGYWKLEYSASEGNHVLKLWHENGKPYKTYLVKRSSNTLKLYTLTKLPTGIRVSMMVLSK